MDFISHIYFTAQYLEVCPGGLLSAAVYQNDRIDLPNVTLQQSLPACAGPARSEEQAGYSHRSDP